MELKDQNILFFARSMGIGGAQKVIMQMCEILKPLVHSITVCSCGGQYVRVLNEMGIQHIDIPDIADKSPFVMLKVAEILINTVRDANITVIHTHYRMAAFYVSALKLFKKCNFIHTVHNTHTDKIKLTSLAYRHAHLIACGETVKENLMEIYKMRSDNITVIRNAVREFEGNKIIDEYVQSCHNQGFIVVGNIGRLSEQKGQKYFLKSIPIIINKCPECRFMIIGSGEDENELKRIAKNLAIDKYICFTGNRTDIQNLMSQLDMIVLSSLWEGMPLAPLEAFSVKKPVIATMVGGTSEIIKDGINGYLVPPKDPISIADRVVNLAEHSDLRAQMGENAYLTFRNEFSYSIFSEQVRQYYRSFFKYG